MILRFIEVTFQREGIHRYPAASEDQKLISVSFLAYPHRHIFHFRIRVSVAHNDRDIEFIMFKRELEALYNDSLLLLDHKSCEMIAEDLIEYVAKKYPGRYIEVGISEDGENGAILKYYPNEDITV